MRIKSLLLVFILLIPSGFVEINSDNQEEEKPKESYSEKDQWNDDLDLPPLQHKKATAKKPILEKADFWLNQERFNDPYYSKSEVLLHL